MLFKDNVAKYLYFNHCKLMWSIIATKLHDIREVKDDTVCRRAWKSSNPERGQHCWKQSSFVAQVQRKCSENVETATCWAWKESSMASTQTRSDGLDYRETKQWTSDTTSHDQAQGIRNFQRSKVVVSSRHPTTGARDSWRETACVCDRK